MTSTETKEKNTSFDENLRKFFSALQPFFRVLWLNRKSLLRFNGIVALVAVAFLIFFPGREYTVSLAILPDYGNKANVLSGLGALSDIASIAGLNVGSEGSTQIYENLITSEAVLAPVVYAEYKTEKFNHPVNLIEYLDISVSGWIPDSLRARYKLIQAVEFLNKRIKTELDRDTKILTVQFRMPEGRLAADVVNAIGESLDFYVRTKRKSNASNQRFYIEKRSAQVTDSLKICEESLASFREHNKVIEVSPQLQLEQTRLMRNVEIQQTVYMELVRQLELAKIQEIQDTPIINIREFTENPVVPSSFSRRVKFILIVFFSALVSASYYYSKNQLVGRWGPAKEVLMDFFRGIRS